MKELEPKGQLSRRDFAMRTSGAALGATALGFGTTAATARTAERGSGNYVVFATFDYDGSDEERLRAIMVAHRERVLAQDDGAIQFDILIDVRSSGRMHLYEVYRDQEAFRAHWNGPTIEQVMKELKGIELKMSSIHSDRV